jgi:PIN domain nuclease of toxin-antitoxin system
MSPRLLLDTHVLVRWLIAQNRLSREQNRTLRRAIAHTEPVALSAVTLLEIAILASRGSLVFKGGLNTFLEDVRSNPVFRVFPLSFEIALDVASLGALQDPADRAIVATARIHQLRLLTSDQRIIDSKLVPVIE